MNTSLFMTYPVGHSRMFGWGWFKGEIKEKSFKIPKGEIRNGEKAG